MELLKDGTDEEKSAVNGVLNVTADINTETGTTIEQIQADVEDNINDYIETIRHNFGTSVNKGCPT